MSEAVAPKVVESVYERLANEEDARVCTDISEEACHVVPGNFLRIVGASTLTKTGDALINPKTTLAWLINFFGAPGWILALIVPLRESGSLIPQLAIATWVRRKPLRKWVWGLGSCLQGLCVAAIGVVALTLSGAAAGLAVLVLLVAFSLARGLCSVSSKDVLGKTIPKTRRGRVSGVAAGVSGLTVVLVGVVVWWRPGDDGAWFYGALLFAAAVLWLLAAVIYVSIAEEPGETGGGGNAASAALGGLSLLVEDRPFRRFVITRALLIGSGLSAPYYVALAQRASGGALSVLGLVILAGGLASSLSAPAWGRLADRSSRLVLLAAALVTTALGVGVFAVERTLGSGVPVWLYPAAFLLLGVAHSGVRLGRKTYVVDMAGGNRRTDYVAVSNTLIGVILLLLGGLTAALSFLPPETLILLFAGTSFAGALGGLGLPEVQQSRD